MSEELKRLWKILNEKYGIFTMEQLREEMDKTKLDIGIFTMPPKKSGVQALDKRELAKTNKVG